MKVRIAGKTYDTDAPGTVAVAQYDNRPRETPNSWHHIDETLYRTDDGRWFLAGEGGALTRYACSAGGGMRQGGSGVVVLTRDEAEEWLKEHGEERALEEYAAEDDPEYMPCPREPENGVCADECGLCGGAGFVERAQVVERVEASVPCRMWVDTAEVDMTVAEYAKRGKLVDYEDLAGHLRDEYADWWREALEEAYPDAEISVEIDPLPLADLSARARTADGEWRPLARHELYEPSNEKVMGQIAIAVEECAELIAEDDPDAEDEEE